MLRKLINRFHSPADYSYSDGYNDLAIAQTDMSSSDSHGVVSIHGVFWRAHSVLGNIQEKQRVRVVNFSKDTLIVDVIPI